MANPDYVPEWLAVALEKLHQERDKLKAECDKREAAYEQARRACVPVQQMLAKINDAIAALGHAAEWSVNKWEEIPF